MSRRLQVETREAFTGPPPMIAAWVTDPLARKRLAAAIRGPRPGRSRNPAITWCDSGDDVIAAVATRGATVVIVEVRGIP